MEMKRSRKWPRMDYSLEGTIKHVELWPRMLRTIRDVIGQSQSACDDSRFDWIEVAPLG